MSRYLHIEARADLDEVAGALSTLSIVHERPAERVVLGGSLECAGDPVDLRISAETAGTAMDIGFVAGENGDVLLVCGDVDRVRAEALLDRIRAEVARARVARAATDAGLVADQAGQVDADGARRIVLRRR